MDRYTCLPELLPAIKASLAASGYVATAPQRHAIGGTRITVMTRGAAVVSLREDLGRDMADITVYSSAEMGGIGVLEELPRLFPPLLGPARQP